MTETPRSRTAIVSTVVVVLLVISVVVALAISHQGRHASKPTALTTTTTSSITGTTTTTTVVVPPFNYKYNIRSSVTTGSCRHAGARWTFSGTVRNHYAKAERVQMVIDFLRTKTAAVVATRVISVPRLAVGSSYRWSVSATIGSGKFGCAVRFAEAFRAKK